MAAAVYSRVHRGGIYYVRSAQELEALRAENERYKVVAAAIQN